MGRASHDVDLRLPAQRNDAFRASCTSAINPTGALVQDARRVHPLTEDLPILPHTLAA